MRRLIWAFVLVTLATGIGALDIEKGRIRLRLDEDSSRFFLFLDTGGESWTPLFVSEDTRSSGLDILEGNQVNRIGDSGQFGQVVEETAQGARFVWTSSTIQVTQEFSFIRGRTASAYDGVQMEILVTNLAEETRLIGARTLFDTYLGETDNTHFSTETEEKVTKEILIDEASGSRYILSSDAELGIGFQFMVTDSQITTPDAIALANWKRLNDSTWDYEVNSRRNFNRLPYSINDSAMMVQYPAEELETNQQIRITAQMGNTAPSGYLSPADSITTTTTTTTTTTVQPTTIDAGLLQRVRDLIARIDALIASADATREDVDALTEALDALQQEVAGP